MYKVNGELFLCGITDSGIVPSREGDIHNFAKSLFLNGSSKSAQTFTVGFIKLLSTHPIHIVVWGNFHVVLLVDLNEFSLIFWKVQHSHSRYQKATSNLKITLNCKLRISNEQPHEGAMNINMVKFLGASNFFFLLCANFTKYRWFRQNNLQGFKNLFKLYKQDPPEHYLFSLFTKL